jgi:hypothetical protein
MGFAPGMDRASSFLGTEIQHAEIHLRLRWPSCSTLGVRARLFVPEARYDLALDVPAARRAANEMDAVGYEAASKAPRGRL